MGSPEDATTPGGADNHNGSTADRDSSIFDIIDEKEIERLGRVRPECFKTRWSEIGFVLSICMAQILVVSCFPPETTIIVSHAKG